MSKKNENEDNTSRICAVAMMLRTVMREAMASGEISSGDEAIGVLMGLVSSLIGEVQDEKKRMSYVRTIEFGLRQMVQMDANKNAEEWRSGGERTH